MTEAPRARVNYGVGPGATGIGLGGGIYQILTLRSERGELTTQRWLVTPSGNTRPHSLSRASHPPYRLGHYGLYFPLHTSIVIILARCKRKGTIRAEFTDTPSLARSTFLTWTDTPRPLVQNTYSWPFYADASWRAVDPMPVEAFFGIQGTHLGSGALFLSAYLLDWCSDALPIGFDIPPTLLPLGGSAQVAELIAIYAGFHLLHNVNLRGTVHSDCLSAVKKITRRWSPGHAFTEAGAALVTSSRSYLWDSISLRCIKGHPERSDSPPLPGPVVNGIFTSPMASSRLETSVPSASLLSPLSGPTLPRR